MPDNALNRIADYFSLENRQRRSAGIHGAVQNALNEASYYVPPEIRNRLGLMSQAAEFTDAADVKALSDTGQRFWNDPNFPNGVDYATAAAATAVPAVGYKMANEGVDVIGDAWRSLVGDVDDAGQAARKFGADESGALNFSRNRGSEYMGEHRAPTYDGDNASLDALDAIYPDDIYSANGPRYYGEGVGDERGVFNTFNQVRGNPDAMVDVYRAVPRGSTQDINADDWVTLSPEYAAQHGEYFDEGADILKERVRAGDLYTDANSINEFGWSPRPRNEPLTPAQAEAQSVLDLIKSGRGAEVTDEMMSAADDTYLWNNYDLPMDEASRMARAKEMGFDTGANLYHGSVRDFDNFIPSERGKIGPGVYLTPNEKKAGRFAGYEYGPNPKLEAAFNADNKKSSNVYSVVATDRPATMEARQAARENVSAYDDRIEAYREKFDELGFDGVFVEDERTILNPSNIRSRFARFDPRLKHLKNLSAAVGGGVMANALAQQQYQPEGGGNDEIIEYLKQNGAL